MADELGDRMKMYERMEAGRRLLPMLPIMARIDGRSFHSFTHGMERPYDTAFTSCMVDTTIELVKQTGALIGYTQSDEINLMWYSDSIKSQIWFDGRISKMCSQLAAQATLTFYRLILDRMPKYAELLPTFDARVWTVPNKAEAVNVFLWRELDATKNSINMAAASYYSHKKLMNKSTKERLNLLLEFDVNWNDYPTEFKRGTYVQRRTMRTTFSEAELERLPARHEAKLNPSLLVARQVCTKINMPVFSRVKNKEAVIFDSAEPIED
jgi:tRNA(His) 5'-end guanylyltransferase